MNSCFKVNNLCKTLGNARKKKSFSIEGLSFEVRAGECLSILGPNGSGKTTTLDTVLGLQSKDEGDILYFGQPLEAWNRRQLFQKIGVVFQETSLYKNLTVAETWATFSSFYPQTSAAAKDEGLARIDLPSDAKIEHLSGGQKKKLLLGLAWMHQPKILFLDEPGASLDPEAYEDLLLELKRLKEDKQVSIILTTHTMDEVEQLADKVLFIIDGKPVAQGHPKELVKQYCFDKLIRVRCGKAVSFDFLTGEQLSWNTTKNFTTYFYTPDHQVLFETLKTKADELGLEEIAFKNPSLIDVYRKINCGVA